MTLADEKRSVRLSAQQKRTKVAAAATFDIHQKLASNIVELVLSQAPPVVVSGFLPIGSEIDVRPCLRRLQELNIPTCLPIVEKKNTPLTFRAWKEGDPLGPGPLNTQQPMEVAPAAWPNILIIPLLAYDALGYRLGWGGGFYDRTLAEYKKTGWSVTAIGVGYDEQQIDQVPSGDYDVVMDWIVTEKRALKIMKAKN